MKVRGTIFLAAMCCLVSCVHSWDSEELEIFDLVEEVNKNFYEFLNISENATNSEIKRAFRSLSIIVHPDKNSAEDANIQFRNLVSIYEVLKDTSKREKYNLVLKNGLPNWKSALYYYRRMRKIGLYEGSLIVFIIITIGQYLFAWAAYLEKKYTAEQVIGTKLKKLQKKNKNIDMDTILNEIPLPSIFNTLPFQIPKIIWNLPTTAKNAFNTAHEFKEIALEKRRLELEEIQRQQELEKDIEEQARMRKEKKENLRRRKQNSKAPEKTDDDLLGYSKIQAREITDDDAVKPVEQRSQLSGGFWTDEDLTELVRLVKKYPSGYNNRWGAIAEMMNRSIQEITFMAAKMKENGYRIPGQCESIAENIVQESQEHVRKQKVKTLPNNNLLLLESNWSQEQQRALESAIIKYKKTTTNGDRWQKIANCVQGKTKDECLIRYKYLCDLVKSQKLSNESKIDVGSSNLSHSSSECSTSTPTAEPVEQNYIEEKEITTEGTFISDVNSKKLTKREERRRRKNLSDGGDSDDVYEFQVS